MRLTVLALTLVFCLTTAAGVAAPNLIPDPDFSASEPQFITSYQLSTHEFDAGSYAIGNDSNQFNPEWAKDISPRDGAEMMIVNGSDQPDMIVWGTGPIKVVPHTIYYFSAYVTLLIADSPPVLVLRINGMRVGGAFKPNGQAGQWVRFAVPWNSGVNTRANISIVDDNTINYGNDFGLDDMSFGTSFVPPSGRAQTGL